MLVGHRKQEVRVQEARNLNAERVGSRNSQVLISVGSEMYAGTSHLVCGEVPEQTTSSPTNQRVRGLFQKSLLSNAVEVVVCQVGSPGVKN